MRTKLLLLLLLTSHFSTLFAQPPANIIFRKLTQQEGLSKNSIWSTYRDQQGFLWVATSSGLNRYDGSTVKEYKQKADDPHSIPSQAVRYITEDKNGRIWMSTLYKIFFLDKKTDRFINIPIADSSKTALFSHLIHTSNGYIFVGQGNYLLRINTKTLEQKTIQIESEKSYHKNYGTYHFTEDKDGWLWFSNYPNLYAYHITTGEIKKYKVLPKLLSSQEPVEAGAITDDGHYLWLGMYSNGGLARFDKRDASILYFPLKDQAFSYAVTAAATDAGNPDYLWVGTKTFGLGLFHKTSLSFIRFYSRDDTKPGSILSNNLTASIEFDKDNTCWVSTSDGVAYFNMLHQPLRTVYIEPYTGKNFNRYQYEYIVKDPLQPQQFYISTKENGILRYDVGTGKIIPFNRNLPTKPLELYYENFIDWMGTDIKGNLWYINLVGLYKVEYGRNIQMLAIDQFRTNKINDPQLYEAIIDKEQQMWIATNGGLWKYNIPKQTLQMADTNVQLLNKEIRYITLSSQQELWMTTSDKSVIQYRPSERYFKEWKIPAVKPNTGYLLPIRIQTDKNNQVWISTPDGLALLNPNDSVIKIFTEKDGFINSSFLQLVYDGNNLLYGGTENGICEINISNKQIRNYGSNEGLLDNSARGGFAIASNELWIGGRNYLQAVNTNNTFIKTTPPLFITDIYANDEKILPNGQQGIKLPYSQNSLQIDYRLLDLLHKNDHEYEYRLLNFKNEWIKAGDINKALFLNLPAGKFLFEVKAINKKTGIATSYTSLQIYIKTPWWQSWWFRIICLLLLGSLLYYFYHQRIAKLMAVERTRQRIGKDLHDDIGTTLSSITLMNTVLKKKIITQPEEAVRLADKVETTSRAMIQNMSDIVWSINPGNDTLEKLMNRLQQFMNDAFEEGDTHHELVVAPTLSGKKINMEARKDVYLICKEIISNAAKYSKASKFLINLHTDGKHLFIHANDNGIGFNTSISQHGNGLINIVQRANKHKGNAVVHSNNDGTNWEISLQI